MNFPSTQKGHYERRLLAEIAWRHLALADVTPEFFEQARWEDQVEYGPLFSAVQWFNCELDDAERMRWGRALAELVHQGLVAASRFPGRKWPNVMLTAAGELALAELRKERVT